MILPKNGRIVIVDDEMSDIKDFMEIFSKDGLSFSYFNGSVETLPNNPLTDTFLVFLDLELDGSAKGNDVTQASQVVSVLERILGDSAKDYSVVIVVWSKSLTILKELKPRMDTAGIKPLVLFEMNKLSCKTEDGHFSLSLIRETLETKMSELPAINLLYFWDNLAGQAAANVYKTILPSRFSPTAETNKLLNTYFEELAKAYKGKEVKAEDSYATINMLNVFLQSEIGRHKCDSLKLDISPENKVAINLEYYAEINARINTAPVPLPLSCGSIHVNPINDIKVNGFDIFEDKVAAKKQAKQEYKRMMQIICEVSTVCDQALDRNLLYRFVPGLLVPSTLENYFKKNADYLYISCLLCNEAVFENSPFYIVLDFRQFFTDKKDKFETVPDLLFQINENLLMHIQNRLGRHVSNPGVVYANHIK
jgi:hypothetical protein